MTNKTIRKIAVSATVLTFLAGIAFAASPQKSDYSVSGEEWNEIAIEEEYFRGATLTVPARTVSVNGTETAATSVLTFPDGTATMLTETKLDMAGLYTLTYSAFANGKIYQTTEQFRVYEKIASVGESSSVEYGRHALSESTDGLIVRLAQNDTLAFSTVIDLRESTADEPIAELFVTPDRVGMIDFAKIIFTLTDIEDPANFLRVSARQSGDGINAPYSYYLAGGNNQPMEGWEGSPWNKLHVNNDWGSPTLHSFYGYYPNGNGKVDHAKISFYYDAETKCVYAGAAKVFVIDLDSPQYFNKPWSGFRSGKVRLSVSADVYSGTTANFVVSRVKGIDLTQEKLVDEVPPEITINTEYSELPVAKTGLRYPVPSATARDDYSGACPVEINVYRNYTSPAPIAVPVTDGAFTPAAEGRYAIVYRTADHEGNETSRILWTEAKQNVSAPAIELPANRIESAEAGTFVPVEEATASGGSGEIALTTSVSIDGEEAELKDGGFRPRRTGTYVVKYTACDYLGQTSELQYTVTVEKGEKPIFESEPVLPRYYLAGSEYEVPALIASDYTSGSLVERPATVTVTDANGTHEVSGKFTPDVHQNGDKITVKFTAGTAELVKEIPVIRPLEAEGERINLKIGNYFVTEGAEVSFGDECATVTANEPDGAFTFANPLLAEGFTLTLGAISRKSQFGGIRIELSDSADGASVAAELVYDGGTTALRAGGNTAVIAAGFQPSAQTNIFKFGYAGGAVSVGTVSLAVTRTTDGKEFKGFASGFVYLRISFMGAQAGAAYEISELNSQPILNTSTDRIRPNIVLSGSYGGTVTRGDEVIVRKGLAGDVFDPTVHFFVTVLDPDGNAVTSTDGVKLENVLPDREYVFKTEKFGQYQVKYSATDTFSEKTKTLGYAVLSEDREAPVFTFDREFPATGKTGEAIVMPDFTVKDNVTETENLIINKYVLTANGMLVPLGEESNSFRPTGTGEYTFVLTAVDEAGNIALVKYAVTVTG